MTERTGLRSLIFGLIPEGFRMRRRALRYIKEEDELAHAIPYVLPAAAYVREKSSPIATFFWVLGAFLLLLAFLLQFIGWLSDAFPFLLPISIPAEWLGWTIWMFIIGLIMSVISIFIQPTGGKILILLLLAGGYIVIATDWFSAILPF